MIKQNGLVILYFVQAKTRETKPEGDVSYETGLQNAFVVCLSLRFTVSLTYYLRTPAVCNVSFFFSSIEVYMWMVDTVTSFLFFFFLTVFFSLVTKVLVNTYSLKGKGKKKKELCIYE